jgi:hypothetical protein
MKKFLIFIIFVYSVTSCSIIKEIKQNGDGDIPVKNISFMLNDSLRIPSLKNKETGILTFTNLNNLNEAEPLGRYLQEKLLYHLFNSGFRIKELRLGKRTKFIPKTGEINITRLKDELIDSGFGKLESIIVGTYVDAGDYYYINVKLIELKNSLIRASGEMKLSKGKSLQKLIGITNKVNCPIYERFPTEN